MEGRGGGAMGDHAHTSHCPLALNLPLLTVLMHTTCGLRSNQACHRN